MCSLKCTNFSISKKKKKKKKKYIEKFIHFGEHMLYGNILTCKNKKIKKRYLRASTTQLFPNTSRNTTGSC